MTSSHLNIQSGGWWVLQDFDAADLFAHAYDETNRPINFAARYGWDVDGDGIPIFKPIVDTRGPVGQWICWPGIGGGGRAMAQWGQVFPAKISATGPLKAKPVSTGSGAGWTAATDMGEIAVFTSDGSSPAVGTFGIVVVGTELGAQKPLFFQGGGGGSDTTYKVTANNADGTYTLQAYDRKGGSTVGSPVLLCEELNLAISVPKNAWVRGFLESDGVIRFSLPLGCT